MSRRNRKARNEAEAQARERALTALATMRRDKVSLHSAAKVDETDPGTVKRFAGSGLRRDKSGRGPASMTKTKKPRGSFVYRDKKTGCLVSKSTWKRSKARGGTRYVRQLVKARRGRGRHINVLGFDGYVPVTVRSSKPAKLASQHLIEVSRFLRTGDAKVLKPYVGKRVGGVALLTDPNRLRELADAGLVKLDALYRQGRGLGREQ